MKKPLLIGAVVSIILGSCQSTGPEQAKESIMDTPTKVCALTFDDGPDPVKTKKVLDVLARYKVPATYFLVGSRVTDSTKPILKNMVSMGHELANHSWDYDSLNTVPAETVKLKYEKTQEAIKRVAGVEAKFFRPPNLAVNQTMFDVIPLPFAEGVLGFDWAGCGTTAQDRAQKVLAGMDDGAIILLHDVQPDPHPTPEALDILIPELKKQGYEFVTLSELFKRKGVDPASRKGSMWKYVR
ncbi:MAG: polysaccharide deacetylase family protein [Treponema sp.]|nr:polysaccharide deacetylase family protein [Treponema sp.]